MLDPGFQKQHRRLLCLRCSGTWTALGLSKEVCFYAGTDWLKLICQSEGGDMSAAALLSSVVKMCLCVQLCQHIDSNW